MRTRENSNNYPYWFYKQTSTNVTTPNVVVPFQTRESDNYILNYIYVQFPTIGAANPTTFRDLRFLLELPQQNKQYIDEPVSLDMITSPGKYDTFTGGLSNPNQTFLRTKRLDQPILCQQTWNIIVSNFQGVGNPLVLDILCIGRNVFKKGRVS